MSDFKIHMALVQQYKIDELMKLVEDLGWDFHRMSSSGQETYHKLCDLLGIQ